MGSVQDCINCPQCGYKKAIAEWHTSGNEWLFCDRCGFNYSTWEDDYPPKNHRGYGAFYIHYKDKKVIEATYTQKIRGKWYKIDIKTGQQMPWDEIEVEQNI